MPNFNKISPTARGIAYLRSFADIPYAKEISARVRVGWLRVFIGFFGFSLKKALALFLPGSELRLLSITNLLKSKGAKNILEIGSGLASRGLIMTEDPAVNYIETDLPKIIEQKEKIVKNILLKLSQTRNNLKFIAADATDEDEILLAAKGLASPVAICLEGVMQYLNREEKLCLAKNVQKILKEKGGFCVTSDIEIKNQSFNNNQTEKNKYRFLKILTGRNNLKNAFKDENDLRSFLGEVGLQMETHKQLEFASDLSSIKIFNLDTEKVRRALEIKKLFILRLAE